MNLFEEIEKHKPPPTEQKKFNKMTQEEWEEWRAKRINKVTGEEIEVIKIGKNYYRIVKGE